MSGRRWLVVAAMLCAAAARAQNPPPAPPPPREQAPAPSPQKPAVPAPAPREGEPDDGLLEFLGSDDVGDAAWWEFLKTHPRAAKAVPPDGKQ